MHLFRQINRIYDIFLSEYIIKHDEIDDEDQDTLEYTLKKLWIFQPDMSNGLTGEEQITLLHPGIYKCLDSFFHPSFNF